MPVEVIAAKAASAGPITWPNVRHSQRGMIPWSFDGAPPAVTRAAPRGATVPGTHSRSLARIPPGNDRAGDRPRRTRRLALLGRSPLARIVSHQRADVSGGRATTRGRVARMVGYASLSRAAVVAQHRDDRDADAGMSPRASETGGGGSCELSVAQRPSRCRAASPPRSPRRERPADAATPG